jgi:hypothetical protein
VLRCQAQLELILILARLVTVLRFLHLTHALRIFTTVFFSWWSCCRQRGSITSSVGVLPTAEDVLTQQQQHQTKANAAAANSATTARVCLQELKLFPPISTVGTVATVLGSYEVWQDSSNDRF